MTKLKKFGKISTQTHIITMGTQSNMSLVKYGMIMCIFSEGRFYKLRKKYEWLNNWDLLQTFIKPNKRMDERRDH